MMWAVKHIWSTTPSKTERALRVLGALMAHDSYWFGGEPSSFYVRFSPDEGWMGWCPTGFLREWCGGEEVEWESHLIPSGARR